MTKKFSASQASKFRNCHAAANLEIAIPGWVPPEEDPDADNAANRGTLMHEIFANVMNLRLRDAKYLIEAMEYVLEVRSRRRFHTLIEVTEIADWLPSASPTTADLVLYLSDELHVFDLKTGKIPVDVRHNDQLLFYAATYLKYAPKAKEVHLHIVQPFADVMEEWVVDVKDLYIWMVSTSDHDVEIMIGDTTFGPGDHCLFCPANPHSRAAKGSPACPAMMQLLYPVPQINRSAVLALDNEEDE